ncbi:MAG: hypothetical protein U0796_16765 [Gemmatales bacterium]
MATTGCKSLFNTSEARNGNGGFNAPGSASELVTHLNKYSAPVQSVESDKLDITVTQNGQPFGLDGKLAFQKGRNFRMVASAIGSTEADLGSNDQEFWFYMKRNDPPDLFFCSYNDLPSAQIKLPLQPDWIAEALCVQELNPAEYEMFQFKSGVELRKRITSNGEQLVKCILIANSGPNSGRVVMHRLVRANNQEIWRAEITEYQLQKDVGNYAIPYQVKITCPEHKVVVELKIKNCKVNQLQAGPQLFQRPQGYKAHDIARLQSTGIPNQTITRTRGGE